jgi:peptidoglycan/LPS O-acetylase OafA/YrhL
MKLNYREDIDGLRAIAVLSVIFNHAGMGLFSGGFSGVDVFFVISGYLITTIIAHDIYANQFSLIKFYERRVRRILPALFAMLVCALAICLVIYDPEKLKAFGKSLVATTLFVSNINFWKESGYFETSSQLKPLLHTWSLAVEEQFYIFFPLLMVFLSRFFKKSLIPILSMIAVVSFGWSVYASLIDSFYLPQLRARELLVGAIIALGFSRAQMGRKSSEILGVIGTLLISIAIFQYSKETRFPGWSALPPVLGTALIIFSGEQDKTFVGRLLGLRPLVFIGKISYSLYLWHWPLIIFGKYYVIRPLTGFETILIFALIFLLSILSWRYIETPFRSKEFIQTKQLFTYAGAAMALICVTGFIVYSKEGFPSRDPIGLAMAEARANDRWEFEKCNINYTENPKTISVCDIGAKSQTPSFLIWGDSHAPTLGKAIHESAKTAGIAGSLSYSPGCPTFLDMYSYPLRGNTLCIDYNHMVLKYLDENPQINTVILITRWTVWVEGTPYEDEEGPARYFLKDTLDELPEDTPEDVLFTFGLERTIQALTALDQRIIIVAPMPEIGYDVPSANFIALQTGRDLNEILSPSTEEYLARNKKTFEILNYFRENYDVQIVEPWKILCVEDHCRVTIGDMPLYEDDDHLSVFGSEMIAPVFDPVFQQPDN